MENNITVRPKVRQDGRWVRELIVRAWESAVVVTRMKVHNVPDLHGLIAEISNDKAGLLTYAAGENSCEIVTLNSIVEHRGVGTALIEEIIKTATRNGWKRVWLITTNDNTEAIEFYKNRGFRVRAIHKDAIGNSRILKPQIPLIGKHGIPIRDEIELEICFG